MRALPLALIAITALTACDGGTEADDQAAIPAEASAPTPTPSLQSPVAAGSEATAIPADMRGRWGLVSADCDPSRSDAKGLLTITADKLEFYESVATLDEIEEATPTRLRATFDFIGEGMTWERDMLIELQDDGRALLRREFGEDAAPDAFRYAQC